MITTQPDLFATTTPQNPSREEIEYFVQMLEGKDWTTAEQLLEGLQRPVDENHKRRLRLIAHASGGRIAGGQGGYKLVVNMTAEEFGRIDAALSGQEASMARRRIEMANVFHSRTRTRNAH